MPLRYATYLPLKCTVYVPLGCFLIFHCCLLVFKLDYLLSFLEPLLWGAVAVCVVVGLGVAVAVVAPRCRVSTLPIGAMLASTYCHTTRRFSVVRLPALWSRCAACQAGLALHSAQRWNCSQNLGGLYRRNPRHYRQCTHVFRVRL